MGMQTLKLETQNMKCPTTAGFQIAGIGGTYFRARLPDIRSRGMNSGRTLRKKKQQFTILIKIENFD